MRFGRFGLLGGYNDGGVQEAGCSWIDYYVNGYYVNGRRKRGDRPDKRLAETVL